MAIYVMMVPFKLCHPEWVNRVCEIGEAKRAESRVRETGEANGVCDIDEIKPSGVEGACKADPTKIGSGSVTKILPNPLLPAPSQDPWVTHHAGTYLALVTDGRRLFLRRSAHVHTLFDQPPLTVWRAPASGPNSKHLWAPELHRLNNRWFIYYAADGGRNRHHRIWVLASTGDDPTGPYRSRGMVETGGAWAIDATILHGDDEQNFLLWSGWEQDEKGPQNLYLAPLRDPLTLAAPRVLLARPDQPWEQRGGAAVCEGPAILRRGSMTCLVYSASASWTVHSCLGLLVHRGGDYLDPLAWSKVGPVFERTANTWGVGHCSLLRTSEEDGVIFYHAKTRRTHGWRDRNVRAQTFTWPHGGLPKFGLPIVALNL